MLKFDIFNPKQSLWSNSYKIRNPKFVLLEFKNDFHINLIIIIKNTHKLTKYIHAPLNVAIYIKTTYWICIAIYVMLKIAKSFVIIFNCKYIISIDYIHYA